MKVATLTVLMGVLFLSGSCLYHNVRSPGYQHHMTRFELTTQDFQILGPVEAQGEIQNVLWLFSWGGEGFAALNEKARAMGGDDVINVNMDITSYGIFIFYNNVGWQARGTAIKYIKKGAP